MEIVRNTEMIQILYYTMGNREKGSMIDVINIKERGVDVMIDGELVYSHCQNIKLEIKDEVMKIAEMMTNPSSGFEKGKKCGKRCNNSGNVFKSICKGWFKMLNFGN